MAKRSCKVKWQKSRFGWDALRWEGSRVTNSINYGLKRRPSAKQRAAARRELCG